MTLNRLLNADNECVGYFTADDAGRAAMQSAQADWDAQAAEDWCEDTFSPAEHRRRRAQPDACPNKCRSIATPIEPLELEDVEPGDGDRVDYAYESPENLDGTMRLDLDQFPRSYRDWETDRKSVV